MILAYASYIVVYRPECGDNRGAYNVAGIYYYRCFNFSSSYCTHKISILYVHKDLKLLYSLHDHLWCPRQLGFVPHTVPQWMDGQPTMQCHLCDGLDYNSDIMSENTA